MEPYLGPLFEHFLQFCDDLCDNRLGADWAEQAPAIIPATSRKPIQECWQIAILLMAATCHQALSSFDHA